MQVNDLIFITDESVHPARGPLVGVLKNFRGSDGLVRVAKQGCKQVLLFIEKLLIVRPWGIPQVSN